MNPYSIVAALFFASTIHAFASDDVAETDQAAESAAHETALDGFLDWWAENAEPAKQNGRNNNDKGDRGGGGGGGNDSSGGH